MALPQIDTSYKPEFELGALYQGYNAANANANAQLQNIFQALQNENQYLQNDRFSQITPYEVAIKALEGNRATAMNTPENIGAYSQGELGSFAKKKVEGDIATGTKDSTIASTNAKNINETGSNNIEASLRDIDIWKSTGGNTFSPILRQAGWSPEKIAQFSSMAKEVDENGKPRLDSISERLKSNLADSVGQRQKLQVEDLKGQWDYWKQWLDNQGRNSSSSIQGSKYLLSSLIQLRSQTMSQISAFEREMQDYGKVIEEINSPINRQLAESKYKKSPEYLKLPKEQRASWLQSKVQEDLKTNPNIVRYELLKKQINELRTQEKELTAQIQANGGVSKSGSSTVIKLD